MSSIEGIQNRSGLRKNPKPPRLVVDLRFTDIESWGEAIEWDQAFRQLSAGRLRGRARVLAGAGCTAMRIELNQVFHQMGYTRPDHVTFGLPYPQGGELNWCRSAVRGVGLLNFSQQIGFEGTTGTSFTGCALSFRREMLEDLSEILGLPFDLDKILHGSGVLVEAGEETVRLLGLIDAAFQSASNTGQNEAAEASTLFDTGAAEWILRLLSRSSSQRRHAVQPARRHALRQALEILEIPENLPITVAELCKRVGVSAPSLYRAFKEEFGVGTKEYIQARILAAVRSELIVAGPGTQINDVANKWGIWHMGRFAANYRKQFGELPSETLLGV
jgi:AraC family ethanolamine operon transcriptional activator